VVSPSTRSNVLPAGEALMSLSVNDGERMVYPAARIRRQVDICQCPVASGSLRVGPVVEIKEGNSVEHHWREG
jgi:hypothetical protein